MESQQNLLRKLWMNSSWLLWSEPAEFRCSVSHTKFLLSHLCFITWFAYWWNWSVPSSHFIVITLGTALLRVKRKLLVPSLCLCLFASVIRSLSWSLTPTGESFSLSHRLHGLCLALLHVSGDSSTWYRTGIYLWEVIQRLSRQKRKI